MLVRLAFPGKKIHLVSRCTEIWAIFLNFRIKSDHCTNIMEKLLKIKLLLFCLLYLTLSYSQNKPNPIPLISP